VVIDGLESVEYSMHPRDHIELEASARINMLVGNAGGVKMRLNDKPVDIQGKSGEVVNIELPQTGK
jgi:cytoskeleton protein RodZ